MLIQPHAPLGEPARVTRRLTGRTPAQALREVLGIADLPAIVPV
jgi:hypothetical protein